MRQPRRKKPALFTVLALLLGLIGVTLPGTPASAAAVMPTLRWPAVNSIAYKYHQTTTSPKGAVTVGCHDNNGSPNQDLITRGPTGSISRQLDRTVQVDGTIKNCITRPVVDKKGDLYGKPSGSSKLFAYSGNTLKWKYDTGCAPGSAEPVVGADGNIYFLNGTGRLIGVTPSLASGQTTPTKVLDVDVQSSCGQGNLLYAYRDGIAVEREYATALRYASYSGTIVGDLPNEVGYNQAQTPVNSEGRVFFQKALAGNPEAVQVSAYDLRARKVVWSTIVSTAGAATYGVFGLYPTPQGGVVAWVQEQRMANGFPATPTEYVHSLVTLSPYGLKLKSTILPNADSSGNAYSQPYAAVDMTGKLVVVRNVTIQRSSSPYQVPGVDIFVSDPATGSVFYTGKIRGNLSSADGEIYGYQAKTTTGLMSVGPDTLYLNTVKCSSSSTCTASTSYTLRAIAVDGLEIDYPRGAVFNPVTRPATPYLALGDSFSSGEGDDPYEDATELPNVNTCHRSEHAYPRLISGTSTAIPALGTSGFRACSGAVSGNIWSYAQWNEGLQLEAAPDTSTQLVTLTIGGNDIGFGSVIVTCATPFSDCDGEFQSAHQKVTTLGDALKRTYTEILNKMPNAQVLVIGYPPMFTTGPGCWAGPNQTDYPFYTETRKQKGIDLLHALNSKISDSVREVREMNQGYSGRLQFVDTDAADSPFIGHDVCSSDPYFHGLILQDTVSSFHPNAAGQQAYAELVRRAMDN